VSNWQWAISVGVPIVLTVVGALYLERRKAAASERGKEDHARSRAALDAIAYFDEKLAEIETGYATPPRDKLDLQVDEQGRVSGFTSGPSPSSADEVRLSARCMAASRWRSERRQRRVRQRLIDLSGRVIVDLAETTAGRSGDDMQIFLTAVSATWSGRRNYQQHDASGRLGHALSADLSNARAIRDARRTLRGLRRLV
jgi:hypothetical protein